MQKTSIFVIPPHKNQECNLKMHHRRSLSGPGQLDHRRSAAHGFAGPSPRGLKRTAIEVHADAVPEPSLHIWRAPGCR